MRSSHICSDHKDFYGVMEAEEFDRGGILKVCVDILPFPQLSWHHRVEQWFGLPASLWGKVAWDHQVRV